MKLHLKIFLISFVCFTLILSVSMFAFSKANPDGSVKDAEIKDVVVLQDELKKVEEDKRTDLEKAVDESERINVLVYGIDGGRADTIMFVSYDPQNKLIDVLSVPRDTYHYVPGHESADQKKINAVYGFKTGGGSEGLKSEISSLLNVPISYYVKVKYEGVEDIVDVLGGVEITVPFNMNYDDPYADPPLHINLNKGKQVLDGDKSIQYLRWRKNNGENGDGDIGRITRQQKFLSAAAKKAFSFKLPSVIKTAFNYIYTDMKVDEMILYATTAVGMDLNELKTYRLPSASEDFGKYYIHDPLQTEEMMLEIYNRGKSE
ncbi:MAG: LCP family protein [Acidaminobacteraceae bacterium]